MPMNLFADQESMVNTVGSGNNDLSKDEKQRHGLTIPSPGKCFLMPAGRCSLQKLSENNGLKI